MKQVRLSSFLALLFFSFNGRLSGHFSPMKEKKGPQPAGLPFKKSPLLHALQTLLIPNLCPDNATHSFRATQHETYSGNIQKLDATPEVRNNTSQCRLYIAGLLRIFGLYPIRGFHSCFPFFYTEHKAVHQNYCGIIPCDVFILVCNEILHTSKPS